MPRKPKKASVDRSGTLPTVEMWPIDRPRPCATNPRKISEKAVKKVAASLKKFGFRQPIVCDEKDEIIIGHTRLKAAEYLGWDQVPVHVATDLTPEEITALRIADNRTGEESTWDEALLADELTKLDDYFPNLDEWTGFDKGQIDKLLGRAEQPAAVAQASVSSFQILITCDSETRQVELLEQLSEQGVTCKSLVA